MPPTRRRTPSLQMQQRTRKERHFDEAEKDLPGFPGVFSTVTTTLSTKDKLYTALSYLGKKNPIPRSVTASDMVWLLDNTAYRNAQTGLWEAEYVAAMFSQHTSNSIIEAIDSVADKINLEERDPAYKTLEDRLGPFVQDIKPGTQVKALYRGKSPMKLGPSGHNGISSDIKRLPGGRDGELVPTFARVPKGANGILEMKTFYAEAEGWGIISDIDDTIKITQTSDPIGILRSTFIDPPEPAPGMPELYRYIHSLVKETSAWFYLSASPYNLYPFLRDFRQNHFPHGTIILRDSSWMSVRGLLTTLTLGTEDYKVDRMEKIHSWLPRRKMICVGDSTQTDPEAYGEIYRRHPNWIKAILIRKVEDIAAIGIESKNEPERFEEAFKDVPRNVWHVFSDPETCRKVVEEVVGGC
ncbi:putative actin filament organization protein app1 protein [Rosellinia necatrix]|uniref:Putative actin filament organization protein app1 protein n=1 Tax=Rosellinia necatrix TaxID=77044 RepID=A0A1W2TUJ5_ROSNE|nr:putative actin filament organization protein app1 protein [Rosellinia necatrix]